MQLITLPRPFALSFITLAFSNYAPNILRYTPSVTPTHPYVKSTDKLGCEPGLRDRAHCSHVHRRHFDLRPRRVPDAPQGAPRGVERRWGFWGAQWSPRVLRPRESVLSPLDRERVMPGYLRRV